MQDKDVRRGAPPPPESREEVAGPILRKVHAGHVASSDGARAFKDLGKKELAAMGVPHATVVHGRNEFSKIVRIPLKFLSKRIRDRVAALPTASKRKYRFKAGDQCAEGVFGVIKRNLKRMNLGGRPANAAINFLSSAWLAWCAGLEAVASGVAMYQTAIQDKIHPKAAYRDTTWLRSLERM